MSAATPGQPETSIPAVPVAPADVPIATMPSPWRLVLPRGVLGLLFGVLAVLMPGPTLASLVLLFSIYALVDGAIAIGHGVRAAVARQPWAWFVVEGVVGIAAAAVAFFLPTLTVLAFVTIADAWAIVSGVAMIIAARRHRVEHGRGLLALVGILSLGWGVWVLAMPVVGAIAITVWLGA